MNEKKKIWYLVFTSILGAKYCDKVPLEWSACRGPSWLYRTKRSYHEKKSANPFIFFYTTHTQFCSVLFYKYTWCCTVAGLLFKDKSELIYPHLREKKKSIKVSLTTLCVGSLHDFFYVCGQSLSFWWFALLCFVYP